MARTPKVSLPKPKDRPSFEAPEWPEHSLWPLARILPYPNNARTHPAEQIALLAEHLKRWGPDQPIVVDEDGVILKGHGRLAAAEEAGLAGFPVVVRTGLPETEKKAIRLADNQIALLSGYDRELLSVELSELKLLDFEMPLLAFTESQLVGYGAGPGMTGQSNPDAAPDLPNVPVSRLGDVWHLGDHRLVCGDSTDAAVARSFGQDAAMAFTDPPYGVAYRDTGAGAWDEKKLAKKVAGTLKPRFDAIKNDELNEEELFNFLAAYMKVQPLKKTAAQYVCHASLRSHVFREALLEVGYLIRAEIIWAKSRPGFNFAHYKHKHEPIYYAVPSKGKVAWWGDNTQTTLWEVASESGAVYKHPTQKPVELAIKAIRNSSQEGEAVYEPFAGSGSTIIACEMAARRCLAIEIEPTYVDVCVLRWQEFSGKVARLASGETFGEMRDKRLAVSPANGTRRRAPRAARARSQAPSPG